MKISNVKGIYFINGRRAAKWYVDAIVGDATPYRETYDGKKRVQYYLTHETVSATIRATQGEIA